MNNAHFIATCLGVMLSVAIIVLVRNDRISPMVAVRWLLIAVLVLVISFNPGLVDELGHLLGIAYPPIIPVLIAIAVALIKILLMDIERQKMQNKLNRIVQRMSILENGIDDKKAINSKFNGAEKDQLGSKVKLTR